MCFGLCLGLGLFSATLGGCHGAPKAVANGRAYPDMKQKEALNIQVFRRTKTIEFTNTTAREFGPSTLWLNGRFSRTIDGLAIGQSMTLPGMKEFLDEFSFASSGVVVSSRPRPLNAWSLPRLPETQRRGWEAGAAGDDRGGRDAGVTTMGRVKVGWGVACGVAGCPILVGGLVSVALLRDRAEPLSFDDQGKVHGTGSVTQARHTSRAPKLTDQIVGGKLVRSEWFRPDGTSIMVTNWKDGSGVGIYVREDGSIRVKMTYVQARLPTAPPRTMARTGASWARRCSRTANGSAGTTPKTSYKTQPTGQKDK